MPTGSSEGTARQKIINQDRSLKYVQHFSTRLSLARLAQPFPFRRWLSRSTLARRPCNVWSAKFCSSFSFQVLRRGLQRTTSQHHRHRIDWFFGDWRWCKKLLQSWNEDMLCRQCWNVIGFEMRGFLALTAAPILQLSKLLKVSASGKDMHMMSLRFGHHCKLHQPARSSIPWRLPAERLRYKA